MLDRGVLHFSLNEGSYQVLIIPKRNTLRKKMGEFPSYFLK